MSYREQLGCVRGEKGKVYIPSIVTRNNKTYITWSLHDESASAPADIDITPQIYLLSVDDNGNISFTLTESTPASIANKNIKGPKGDPGEVDTAIVNTLPDKTDAVEGVIYIHDGIATVYDKQTNDFYDLDDILKFDNYYTKTESKEEFYTKTQIDNMLGNIVQCQQAIIYTLDKNSINISSGG